jgi:hypothetical protein
MKRTVRKDTEWNIYSSNASYKVLIWEPKRRLWKITEELKIVTGVQN